MRWSIEVTPPRPSPAPGDNLGPVDLLVVEAKSWQAALQSARAHENNAAPISQLSIELLGDGYRATDPATKTRYLIRKAAPDTPLRDPGTNGTAHPAAAPAPAPAAAPTPAAPAPPEPAAPAPVAAPVAPAPASPPVTAPVAAAPVATEPVAAPVATAPTPVAAPAATAPVTRPPAAPAPETPAAVAATPAVRSQPPPAASGGLPSYELVLAREEEPSARSPLTYRECVYAVPHGTTEQDAERLLMKLWTELAQQLWASPPGKFINLAVFDVVFTGKPPRPPLVTLTWKDWRGPQPEIAYPMRQRTSMRPPGSASLPPGASAAAPVVVPAAAPLPAISPSTPPAAPVVAAPAVAATAVAPMAAAPVAATPAAHSAPPPAAAPAVAPTPVHAGPAPTSAPVSVPSSAPISVEPPTLTARPADLPGTPAQPERAENVPPPPPSIDIEVSSLESPESVDFDEAPTPAMPVAKYLENQASAAAASGSNEPTPPTNRTPTVPETPAALAEASSIISARPLPVEVRTSEARTTDPSPPTTTTPASHEPASKPVELSVHSLPSEGVKIVTDEVRLVPPPTERLSDEPRPPVHDKAAAPAEEARPATAEARPATTEARPAATEATSATAEARPAATEVAAEAKPAAAGLVSADPFAAADPFATPRKKPTVDARGKPVKEGRRLAGDELLSDLFEAMHDIHFQPGVLEAAHFVLWHAVDKMPCEVAVCHLFDINRREFVVVHALGDSRASLLLKRAPEREALISQVMRRRRSMSLPGTDGLLSGERWKLAAQPVESALVAPVSLGGRFLGLLELVNPVDGGQFSESDSYALAYMGEQFAEFLGQRGVMIDPDAINAFKPPKL